MYIYLFLFLGFQYIKALLHDIHNIPSDIIIYKASKDILGIMLLLIQILSYSFFMYKIIKRYFKQIKNYYQSFQCTCNLFKNKDVSTNTKPKLQLQIIAEQHTKRRRQSIMNPINSSFKI